MPIEDDIKNQDLKHLSENIKEISEKVTEELTGDYLTNGSEKEQSSYSSASIRLGEAPTNANLEKEELDEFYFQMEKGLYAAVTPTREAPTMFETTRRIINPTAIKTSYIAPAWFFDVLKQNHPEKDFEKVINASSEIIYDNFISPVKKQFFKDTEIIKPELEDLLLLQEQGILNDTILEFFKPRDGKNYLVSDASKDNLFYHIHKMGKRANGGTIVDGKYVEGNNLKDALNSALFIYDRRDMTMEMIDNNF